MSRPSLAAEHGRRFGTTEERHVLALEKIADQLELVAGHLLGSRRRPHDAEGVPAREADRTAGDAPDDPHTFDEALPEIDRTLVEHFAVGGYRYTDLQHAIAQARRARAAQSIADIARRQEYEMAKGQKRSNRETRKPKAEKPKANASQPSKKIGPGRLVEGPRAK